MLNIIGSLLRSPDTLTPKPMCPRRSSGPPGRLISIYDSRLVSKWKDDGQSLKSGLSVSHSELTCIPTDHDDTIENVFVYAGFNRWAECRSSAVVAADWRCELIFGGGWFRQLMTVSKSIERVETVNVCVLDWSVNLPISMNSFVSLHEESALILGYIPLSCPSQLRFMLSTNIPSWCTMYHRTKPYFDWLAWREWTRALRLSSALARLSVVMVPSSP